MPQRYQTQDGHIVEKVDFLVMENSPPYLVKMIKPNKEKPSRFLMWFERNDLIPINYDEDLLPKQD